MRCWCCETERKRERSLREAIRREKKIGPFMEVGRGGGTREAAREGTLGGGAGARVIEEWHSPARPP